MRLHDPKARWGRRWIVLLCAWVLLAGFSAEVLAQPTNAPLEQRIQADVMAFLSARTPSVRAGIATRVATAIVASATAESLSSDLATWTGALVGISGTNAPVVAAAIVRAVGPRYRDVVLAAVALVSPSESDGGKTVQSALAAVPTMNRATAKTTLENPDRVLSAQMRQGITELLQVLGRVQANWDSDTSRPKRDIFADQDGGERAQERDPARVQPPNMPGGE